MGLTDKEAESLGDMLGAIEADINLCSDWERGFVKDQLDRYAKYGADIRLSPKQWAMIRKIYKGITGSEGDTAPPDEDDRDYD